MRALRIAALTGLTLLIVGCPEPVTPPPPPPPPDTTPPTLTAFTPAEGATDIAFDRTLTATFSEAVASDGLGASLRQGTTALMGTTALSSDKKTLTFTPAAPLPEKASLVFSVTSFKDEAGNAGAAGSVTFTTRVIPPTVTSTSPANAAMGVAVDADVSATFSRAMDSTSLTATSFTLTEGGNAVPATIAYDAMSRTATLTPMTDLLEARTYSATLTTGALDSLGTALSAPYSFNFTTGSTPPTVTISPAHMALDVPGNQSVVFTFSEVMNQASLMTAVTVTTGGMAVPGTFTWNALARTFTFVPMGAYPAGGTVVASVATSALDLSGIALAAAVSSTFTISIAPALSLTSPTANELNVLLDADVTLTFTVPMDTSTLAAPSVRILDAAMNVVAATYTTSTNSVRVAPNVNLDENAQYTIVVTTGVRSAGQIAFPAEHRQTFRTVSLPPRVVAVTPADNSSGAPLTTTVRLTFSEDMNTSSFSGNIYVFDGANNVMGSVATMDARNAVFTPAMPLLEQARYVVIAEADIADLGGNQMGTEFRSSFVAEAQPRITSITPAANEVGVPQASAIVVAFNKPLNPAGILLTAVSAPMPDAFTLTDGATRIEGSITWEVTSRTARINRTNGGAPLAWTAGRRYVLDIDGSKLSDLNGNMVGGRIVTSFVAGTASDSTAPTVVASSPGNGDTGVARTGVLSADFSEAIDASSLNATTVQVLSGTTAVAGRLDYVPSLRRVQFVPAVPLAAMASLTFNLAAGIRDMSGNLKGAATSIPFTTDINTPPSVVRVTPAAAAMNVNVNAGVRVDFSEAVDPSTLRVTLMNGMTALPGTTRFDAASRSVVFDPTAPLPPMAALTFTVLAGVGDLEGATMASDFSSTFATSSTSDLTLPFIMSTSPTQFAAVGGRPTVVLNFSEPMNAATIIPQRLVLEQVGGSRVPTTLEYDLSGDRAVIRPLAPLMPGVTYQVFAFAGLEDLAGNSLDHQTFNLRFSIEATRPTIISRTPAMGVTVGSASRVELVFSEDMDPASIDANSFTLTFNAVRVFAAVSYDPGTRTAVLQPAVPLADGLHTITLNGTVVRDLTGNTVTDTSTFTVSSLQPAIVSATPCGTIVDAYDLATRTITITFDRPVRKAGGGALDGTALKLRFNNMDEAAAVAHVAGNTVATITPSSPLSDSRTYEVQATTGVVDNATGAALGQSYSCTFQTQRVAFRDLVDDNVTTGYTLAGAGGNVWQRVNSADDARSSIVWRGGNQTDGANYTRACAPMNAADHTVSVERMVDLTGFIEAELRFDEFHLINSAALDRGRVLVISGATTRELTAFTGNASGYSNRVGQGSLNLRDFVGGTVRIRFELFIKGANLSMCSQALAGNKGLFVDNLYVVGR